MLISFIRKTSPNYFQKIKKASPNHFQKIHLMEQMLISLKRKASSNHFQKIIILPWPNHLVWTGLWLR